MKTWIPITVLIVTLAVFIGYAAVLIFQSWPLADLSITKASLFGDSFGFLSSLFSALAFVMLVWTLVLQQQQLRLQREEMSKMVGTQLRQLHITLQTMAMEKENLQMVWTGEGSEEPTFQQKAYVNLMLSHWEMQFNEGLLTQAQTEIVLKRYLGGNRYFRGFWTPEVSAYRKEMSDARQTEFVAAKTFHDLASAAFTAGTQPAANTAAAKVAG